MNMTSTNENIVKRFGKYSLFIGIMLIIIGTTGILLPALMSLETVVFIASFMLVGGVFWALHTYKYSKKSVMDWLKPLVLILTGGLMFFMPSVGIATVGLMLSFYLMMDAFGSFTLAQSLHPDKGWGWMALNGVFSIILAVLFLIGWPQTSLWLVGLYVAISLIFDGWALVFIGWNIKKTS
ncbi:MAG TPA: hypothetical protein ENJ60_03555 [Aeromonadales bacterium]|nr:hypothetical protein [Aeromonadales bacterium]